MFRLFIFLNIGVGLCLCICKEGFSSDTKDGSTCLDINECEVFGSCSQLCKNSEGSFQCSCLDGFEVGIHDNRTCSLKDPSWKLLYATRTEVGYKTILSDGNERKFRITPSDGRPVGVTYDARNSAIYWTDASTYSETIFRSSIIGDPTIEVIADTGLLLPEGIAFDWITGNIYFADSNFSHIAICGNVSNLCSILLEEKIDRPRDIALHPNLGIMFWSDWGKNPAIMKAGMDASNPIPIVLRDLKWPNGITIDYGNSRIYWVDARLDKIESSRFDGTDRQFIIVKRAGHPFGVDILGDRLYWSDWNSRDVKSVNKFTGLNESVHLNDPNSVISGIALYHITNQPIQRSNPCLKAGCSHICALSPVSGFDCLCPVGMVLKIDEITCEEPVDLPKLAIAFKNTIKFLRFNSIGKDVLDSISLHSVKSISAVVYNPINHTLILSDSASKKIYEYSLSNKRLNILIDQHLDTVKAIDIDIVGENLYWIDEGKQTIEVMSLRTHARSVLMTGIVNPYDILMVPELRTLFIARMTRRGGKLFKMLPNGDEAQVILRLGEKEPIALAYDHQFGNILWADKIYRGIGMMRPDGKSNSYIVGKLEGPPWDVVKFQTDVYWIDMFSKSLKVLTPGFHFPRVIRLGNFADSSSTSKNNTQFFAKLAIINKDMYNLEDLRNRHECSFKNRNRKVCSHICLMTGDDYSGVCRCPDGLALDVDGKTCVHMPKCSKGQLTCKDGNCISHKFICDGVLDCSNGDDEVNCNRTSCSEETFNCESNGVCIPNHWVCDGEKDCLDGTDEGNCSSVPCNPDLEFRCESTGRCIPKSWQCNRAFDCPGDDSDERGCNFTCPEGFFQCHTSLHCIVKDWVCDGDPDCEDKSDELANCTKLTCGRDQFMCNSGKCIDKSLLCDGFANCVQNEDEQNCTRSSVATTKFKITEEEPTTKPTSHDIQAGNENHNNDSSFPWIVLIVLQVLGVLLIVSICLCIVRLRLQVRQLELSDAQSVISFPL